MRKIRSVTSECSAGRTDVRASARKVRYSATSPRWLACPRVCARRFQRALPPQGTTTRDSRPARFVDLAIHRFRALPAMRAQLAFGFAGVCEMYEGHKHLCRLRRRRPRACCLPCVESAMCSRAGPVGVSCPGLLSPPFRDSGSASPFLCLARTSLGQTFDIKKTHRLQRFGWRFCYRRLPLGLR